MEKDRGWPATVLLVEDIGWIRAGMRRILRRYGYRVLEAANDTEAIRQGEGALPDLILTEEEIPTLDALTARLRAHPTLKRVPVVIVNPDEAEGARYGDIFILPDYDSLGRFIASIRISANGE